MRLTEMPRLRFRHDEQRCIATHISHLVRIINLAEFHVLEDNFAIRERDFRRAAVRLEFQVLEAVDAVTDDDLSSPGLKSMIVSLPSWA